MINLLGKCPIMKNHFVRTKIFDINFRLNIVNRSRISLNLEEKKIWK